MSAVADRLNREASERLAWTAYGLAVRFPGGPLGGNPATALNDWVEALAATHGADERTDRAAQARRDRIDRATLNAYLASPEYREALAARPGFGLPGTAILPPTPRPTAMRNGSVGFRVIAPYPEADTPHNARSGPRIPTDKDATGYVAPATDGNRARAAKAVRRIQADLLLPVTPGEASAVIDYARRVRFECVRSYPVGVQVCDRAIRRARQAQYSARPVS